MGYKLIDICPYHHILTCFYGFPFQSGVVSGGVHDGYWKPGTENYPNQYSNTQQHIQMPLETSSTYENFQNQQNSSSAQQFTSPYPSSHQVPQSYQSSLQPLTQNVSPLDSHRGSKLQIPTNPRIASNLPLTVSKTEKDAPASGGTLKPAYISVSLQKPNDRAPTHDIAADSILKVEFSSFKLYILLGIGFLVNLICDSKCYYLELPSWTAFCANAVLMLFLSQSDYLKTCYAFSTLRCLEICGIFVLL